MANETVFRRYPGNPIIVPSAVPGANSIFNSAVLKYGRGYAGVFRIDMQDEGSELHTGWSEDGVHWRIEPKRINITGAVPEGRKPGLGYDPRVTRIGRDYYVTWCCYPAGAGPCIGLGKTRDFKKYKQLCTVMLPYNRNAVLFPRRIKGKYAVLHRPCDQGHTPFGDMYFATSPDLVHWGDHRFVFGPSGWWESTKVGAGPTPIETREGWLLIYHGVRTTCNGFVYCAGGAILDLERPWKAIYHDRDSPGLILTALLSVAVVSSWTNSVPADKFINSRNILSSLRTAIATLVVPTVRLVSFQVVLNRINQSSTARSIGVSTATAIENFGNACPRMAFVRPGP